MVIFLTGLRGAGKSSLAREMVERGWTRVALGDLIRARAEGSGLTAHAYGDMLRERYGPEAVARLVEDAAISRDPLKLVIDGVYMVAEHLAMKAYFQCPTYLIGVVVDDETRLARLRGRGRDDDRPGVLEALESRHDRLDIKHLLEQADLVVQSADSPRDNVERVCDFLAGRTHAG